MNRRKAIRGVVIAVTTTMICFAAVWVLEDQLDYGNRPVQKTIKRTALRARWLWLPGFRLTNDRVRAFYVRALDAFLDRHQVSLPNPVPVVMSVTDPPFLLKALGPRYDVVRFHDIERRAAATGTYGFLLVGPADPLGMVALHVEVSFHIEGSGFGYITQEKFWCWPLASTCQPDT